MAQISWSEPNDIGRSDAIFTTADAAGWEVYTYDAWPNRIEVNAPQSNRVNIEIEVSPTEIRVYGEHASRGYMEASPCQVYIPFEVMRCIVEWQAAHQ